MIMGSVVHIVQRMSPGGIETLAMNLVNALPGRHRLVSLEGETRALITEWPRLRLLGDAFIALNKPAGRSFGCIRSLATLLRRERAATIVTHHIGPLLYGSLAGIASGRPSVIHVEHDAWHLQDRRRRLLFTTLSRFAQPKLIGVSGSIVDNLANLLPRARARVIPNGVDVARFDGSRSAARARLGLSAQEPVVGSIGRLEAVKGHDVLLEAAALMRTPARIVIGGDGSRRVALEAQAASLGLGGRVRFLGAIDLPEQVYPAFDVFCLPSRQEGLPLALLEAQAAGVRAVACEVGDVRSALCPQSGRLAPAVDAAALAAALDAALADGQAPSPRGFVASRFDWSATVMAYARVIGEIE
jgi:glycosyltransferase involved in cell wall biosynthesis